MSRPRVLVFSSLLPFPVDRGDRNRLFHTLQLLASFATVRLVAVERAWEPPVLDDGALAGVEIHRVRVSAAAIVAHGAWAAATGRPYLITRFALPSVRRAVRAQVRAFAPDVFWGYQAASIPFLADVGRARRIIDLVDSPSRYAALVVANRDVPLTSRLAMAGQWRIAAHERRAIAVADAALVNSETDAAYARSLGAAPDRVVLLDNCIPQALMRDPWMPDPIRPARNAGWLDDAVMTFTP